MALDQSIFERNRAATERIRRMAALSDEELRCPVGEHWTVSILLAHLAFWERRGLSVLDLTEREGKLVAPEVNVVVNDISLPLWAAIPPREAGHMAVEAAEMIDQRLETFSPDLLEQVYAYYPRWVERFQHRNEHLDEAEAALSH